MGASTLSDMYYRSMDVVESGFTGNTLADYKEVKKPGRLYKVLGAAHDDYYCVEIMGEADSGFVPSGIMRLVYIGELDNGFLYETLTEAIGHGELLGEEDGEEATH